MGEADGRPEVCLALSARALSLWASHRRLAIAAALCAEVAAAARRAAAVLARAGPSAPRPARVRAAVFHRPLRIHGLRSCVSGCAAALASPSLASECDGIRLAVQAPCYKSDILVPSAADAKLCETCLVTGTAQEAQAPFVTT